MNTVNTIKIDIGYADLSLNMQRREVACGNRVVVVKKTSLRLFSLLLCNAGSIVSRKSIFIEVWGFDFEPGTKRLEVQLNYLRGVLSELGSNVRIKTYRGKGLFLYHALG